ncbi:Glycosyltransferase involved in cell wall bisynthesis [Verrucomicrobium sp. GAS474]|uniref:glycosyltransferase family 4 protein n=1 Tax=Verrucomicrobium sp. GAS474 TaxID=1882831 RepID=UPI000879745D|nr:glycosyltransferase family 1 protein [Verrucomicrobium sp. GAS474]SDT86100.1 Glycosyltransferase involved in cell wall bisynthesis [Verrucomicrobium sp. GAS474]
MTIVLVGNYAPDQQESMRRFGLALKAGYARHRIEVVEMTPGPLFRRGSWAESRFGKWLGYVDKYMIFPWRLRARLDALKREGKEVVLHICDHSNAIYLLFTHQVPSLVTCHDVLAITAAMGDYPLRPTQWSGRILQRAILAGLNRADHVVCVSQRTASSLRTLSLLGWDQISVIYGGWIHECAPASAEDCRSVRERYGLPERYLLHIGGNAWYKNRPGVIDIYAALLRRRPDAPPLVLAGKVPDAGMNEALQRNRDVFGPGGKDRPERIIYVTDFPDEILSALYTGAEALLFPSLEEGFGVPLTEALACGCPIVTSNRPPMSTVTGGNALLGNPDDFVEMAGLLEVLLDEPPEARRQRIAAGLDYFRHSLDGTGSVELYFELCRRLLHGWQAHPRPPAASEAGSASALAEERA